jgi:molecular chaperone GrpE
MSTEQAGTSPAGAPRAAGDPVDGVTPAEGDGAPTELARVQQALEQAEGRAREHWEQYLRAVAELDNVRKRAQRDIEAANRYGLEKFAAELLPVQDSLELAVHSAEQADVDPQSLKQGQEATLKLLTKALGTLGITPILPLGEPFDPARHEAMLAQESATAAPNTVLQVVQTGYELNGRLLRPARVIVAKAAAQSGPPPTGSS